MSINGKIPLRSLRGLSRDLDKPDAGTMTKCDEQRGSNPDAIDPDELYRRTHATWEEDLECQRLVAESVKKLNGAGAGEPGMTLDEVGRYFGITRERTRQIERAALRKMKARGISLELRRDREQTPSFDDNLPETA